MFNSLLKSLIKDKRGATVFIAVGIAFLLMVFSIGIAATVRSTDFNIKAFKASSGAKNIAESVMGELVSLGNAHDAGFSLSDSQCDAYMSNITYVQDRIASGAEIKCSIKGRPEISDQVNGWYTIPSVNTGDASNNCNSLRPVKTEKDLVTMGLMDGEGGDVITDPLDHPCNWGKLNFGTSISSRVAVPLYYDASESGETPEIMNIGSTGVGASELILRVRTACKPVRDRSSCATEELRAQNPGNCKYDDICREDDRYEFGVNPLDTVDVNKTIAQWQITGECVIDGVKQTCAIGPNKEPDERTGLRNDRINTEIYMSFINNGKTIDLLNGEKEGEAFGFPRSAFTRSPYTSEAISHLLTFTDATFPGIQKPLLQLSIIARELKDLDGNRIPNLEYQIQTQTSLSSSSQEYEVQVNYQGQTYVSRKSVKPEKNVVDFAIQN